MAPERRRVSLRPITPDDAPSMAAWWQEDSVRRFQPLDPKTPEQFRRELRDLDSPAMLAAAEGSLFRWIVEVDRVAAGWLTLSIASWSGGVAELAYSLSTPYQGRGVMGIAVDQLLDELSNTTALRRLEARCAVPNVASRRMIERAGFRLDPSTLEWVTIRGERFACRLYVLDLDDRWRSLRADASPR